MFHGYWCYFVLYFDLGRMYGVVGGAPLLRTRVLWRGRWLATRYNVWSCPMLPHVHDDMLPHVIMPHVIKLTISKLIQEHRFTLEFLNNCKTAVKYGFPDCTDKPVPIPKQCLREKNNFLQGKANQNLWLLMFLPLFVGHKIPKDNKMRKMFLRLRWATDIVLTTSIKRPWVPYLEHFITECLDSLLELFSGQF